jgi:hypothetical protein
MQFKIDGKCTLNFGAYTGETKHTETTRVLSNQLILEQINHHSVHHSDYLSNNPHRTTEWNTHKLNHLNYSVIEVRHGLSAAVPEILNAAVADGEEDGDTRPLHTGPPNRVGEPQ